MFPVLRLLKIFHGPVLRTFYVDYILFAIQNFGNKFILRPVPAFVPKLQNHVVSLYFIKKITKTKAELLEEGIIFLIHLFTRAILLMKKLKIEETKAT